MDDKEKGLYGMLAPSLTRGERMSTLKDLRLQARLSIASLATLAGVDRKTIERAERGRPVQDVKAYAIAQALSEKLGREIKLADIEGLNVL